MAQADDTAENTFMTEKISIKIEQMLEQDCEAVWELQKMCFSVPWSLAGIREMFDTAGYLSLIARSQGRLVGYVGLKAVLDEADITNVAVHPRWRRQGVGKRLVEALLREAGAGGICRIFLEVRASNAAAQRLYQQAGFQTVDVRRNYYDKPKEDAHIMVCTFQ